MRLDWAISPVFLFYLKEDNIIAVVLLSVTERALYCLVGFLLLALYDFCISRPM
jgi:hypothetical protein